MLSEPADPTGGAANGERLLVFPLAVRAGAGAHLLHRLPRCGEPVRAAARRARAAAGAGVGARRCRSARRPASSTCFPPTPPSARLRGSGLALSAGGALTGLASRAGSWATAAVWALALAALPLVRQRRPDLLRLRLGNAPARDGVPRDLSRRAHDGTGRRDHLAVALAAVPADVRRGAHQVARRSVLARPHVSRLLLRDAADAEPADVVLPLAARVRPPRRRGDQPRRRARRSVPLLRAAADRGGRRRSSPSHFNSF